MNICIRASNSTHQSEWDIDHRDWLSQLYGTLSTSFPSSFVSNDRMISGWQNPSSSVISKGRMIKWDYQISCLISVIQGRSVSKWSQDDKIPSFRSRSGMHQRLGGEKTGWFWNGSNEHWMTVLTGLNNEWHSNTVCAIPKCDTWSPSSSFPWFYFHHLISFYRRSDDIISSNDIRMTFDLVPLSLRTHIYRSFSARSGLERHVLHPQVRFS